MEDKKVFIPTQLAALLHPIPLKILLYMVNMQGLGAFKIYASALAGILKMKEEHLKMGVQTLIDNNLISISKNDEGTLLQNSTRTHSKSSLKYLLES